MSWSQRPRRNNVNNDDYEDEEEGLVPGGYVLVFHRIDRDCWDEGHFDASSLRHDDAFAQLLLPCSLEVEQVIETLTTINQRLTTLPAIFVGWSAALPACLAIVIMLFAFIFNVPYLPLVAGLFSLIGFAASIVLFGYYYWRVGSALDRLLESVNKGVGDTDDDGALAPWEWRRGRRTGEDDKLFLIIRLDR